VATSKFTRDFFGVIFVWMAQVDLSKVIYSCICNQ